MCGEGPQCAVGVDPRAFAMSAWRRRLQALHNLPPGQHLAREFDLCDMSAGTAQQALGQCVSKGYASIHWVASRRHDACTYALTPLGRNLMEGRVRVLCRGAIPGSKGRSRCTNIATWLAALPRCNEIKLTERISCSAQP